MSWLFDKHHGTYLGFRLTKNCNICKVHEHYGYWTISGKRQFEMDCLENDFLLSSEDTAVGLPLIRHCANLLIVRALALSTISLKIDCLDIKGIWRRQEIRLEKTNTG